MSAPRRPPREDVDGVVLIDKPLGLSSQQVVSRVKHIFNAQKAGHGGTLDPLASGLLVVGLGEATKFLQRHLNGDKAYRATIALGTRTSTGDREGEIVARSDVRPTREQFERTLPRFEGEISQTPPAYSALKIDGKPAYARARDGESVTLAARPVRIDRIALVSFENDSATIDVRCGAGTYIRTLAEDLAIACGTQGHLSALRRTQAKHFHIGDAISLDALATIDVQAARAQHLRASECLVQDMPEISLSAQDIVQLSQGRRVPMPPTDGVGMGDIARVTRDGQFFGLVQRVGDVLIVERWQKMKPRGNEFAGELQ